MNSAALEPFFKPKSIAVIGASRNPAKIGYQLLRSIILAGYDKPIYPINPKADEILGLKAYPSILEVEDEVDLAVIAVPAPIVPKVTEECGKKGVKCVIVISGGFKEVGGEGAKLEEEVVKIAKKYGMRLMGAKLHRSLQPPHKNRHIIPTTRKGVKAKSRKNSIHLPKRSYGSSIPRLASN